MVGFQKVLRDKVVLLIGVASVVALSVFLSNRYDQSQITPKDTASAELLTKKDFDICEGVKYGIPNYGDEAKRRLLTPRKCEQLKKHDSAQNAPQRAASPENLLKKKAELTKKAEQGQAGAQFELGGHVLQRRWSTTEYFHVRIGGHVLQRRWSTTEYFHRHKLV